LTMVQDLPLQRKTSWEAALNNKYQTTVHDVRRPSPLLLGEDLVQLAPRDQLPVILSADDIEQSFGDLARLEREVMIAGAVNGQCQLLCWHVIAVGSSNQLIIRTGDAFSGALRHCAHGIFLVHNHPAGTLEPSQEDLKLTRDVHKAGRLLGYPLLDHVIIARNGSRSILHEALTETYVDRDTPVPWAGDRAIPLRLVKRRTGTH